MPRLRETEMGMENYEPPAATRLRFWRHTKKQHYVCGNVHAPGWLDYNASIFPLLCFIAALVLESWGLFILFKAGMSGYFALFLGLVDLIFAITQHLPVGRIQELKNLLAIVQTANNCGCPNAPDRQWADRIKKMIRLRLWLVRAPISCAIIGIAIFKVITFYSFIAEMNPQVLLISLTYLIVATIHIWWTGYFIFWLCVEVTDLFQHRRYKKVIEHNILFPDRQRPVPHMITDYRLRPFGAMANFEWRVVDRHVLLSMDILPLFQNALHPPAPPGPAPSQAQLNNILSKICPMDGPRPEGLPQRSANESFHQYVLVTWGIMTDTQVMQLAAALPGYHCIVLEAIKHQVVDIMSVQPPWTLVQPSAPN